jgi:ubiquinone/menaquinone biosynthesis C-methylase UbiE
MQNFNDEISKWNDRYKQPDYTFGDIPNEYFKEQIDKLEPGRILFPAEGEGRNAVYAAKLGWEVNAFDLSEEGKKKAEKLAKEHGVTIHYKVGEFSSFIYAKEEFDAIALIYAHFPAAMKSNYHRVLNGYLKEGGIIIFEAFSKKHLDYVRRNEKVGGPKDLETLFSIEEVQSDFQNYNFIEISEQEIELNEGLYHIGTGSVIRFVARKEKLSIL